MKKDIFKELKYFSRDENWGNPDKINPELLYRLDKFRGLLGVPVYINCAYATSGHTSRSQHYLGNAVDVNFHNRISLLDAYIIAEKIGFNGIGLYPHWHYPGLHLDVRPLSIDAPKARWMGVRLNNKQVYVGLNHKNMIEYGVIKKH